MTKPPPVLGVAEIVLSVRDLPTMREFYREVLGFELLAAERNFPQTFFRSP